MLQSEIQLIKHFLIVTQKRIKELEVLKKHNVISKAQIYELDMCYCGEKRAIKAFNDCGINIKDLP